MRKPKARGVNSIKKIQATRDHANPQDRWAEQRENSTDRDTSGLDYSFRASDIDSEEGETEEDENDLTLGSQNTTL